MHPVRKSSSEKAQHVEKAEGKGRKGRKPAKTGVQRKKRRRLM